MLDDYIVEYDSRANELANPIRPVGGRLLNRDSPRQDRFRNRPHVDRRRNSTVDKTMTLATMLCITTIWMCIWGYACNEMLRIWYRRRLWRHCRRIGREAWRRGYVAGGRAMRPIPRLPGKGVGAIIQTNKPRGIATESMWPKIPTDAERASSWLRVNKLSRANSIAFWSR